MPKFLSDSDVKPAPMATERRETPAMASGEPELRPVPASVFDDDFFQAPPQRMAPSHLPDESVRVEAGMRETAYFEAEENVQLTEPVVDPIVRAPFGGAVAEAAEPDELDIPAFLRRGH
jgi:cell division protein FtsZ